MSALEEPRRSIEWQLWVDSSQATRRGERPFSHQGHREADRRLAASPGLDRNVWFRASRPGSGPADNHPQPT